MDNFKFLHPSNSIVAGMTSSGKTEFAKLLIKNWKHLININTTNLRVLWCFSEIRSIPQINNVELQFNKGIPSLESIEKFKPDLIVLDDLMDDINQDIKNLFTKVAHHRNISVVLIVQNLFNQNKQMRTISLNSHYIVLMKGIRNLQQVEILGRQIFPSKSKQLVNIFKHATQKPFGYLVIDLHPRSNDKYRLRTRIFPEELPASLINKHSFSPIYYDID